MTSRRDHALDVGPALEAAPLERERAQRLPPHENAPKLAAAADVPADVRILLDARFGDSASHELAEHHIATNADAGTVEVHRLDEVDPYGNPVPSRPVTARRRSRDAPRRRQCRSPG